MGVTALWMAEEESPLPPHPPRGVRAAAAGQQRRGPAVVSQPQVREH